VAFGQMLNRWLLFGSSIDHCIHIGDVLSELGITNVVIHSKLKDDVRDTRIKMFLAGRVRAAVNNNILTTGFDCPEIDYLVWLTKTMSTNKWVQGLGRGTRPAPWAGKEGTYVLDFGNNAEQLGPIDDPVIPREPGAAKFERAAAMKVCPGCGFHVGCGSAVCGRCAYDFGRPINFEAKASDGVFMAAADSKPEKEPEYLPTVVHSITYTKHQKTSKPDSVCVAYHCGPGGIQVYREWLLFDHSQNGKARAQQWWRARVKPGAVIPESTAEAMACTADLVKVPKKILLRVDTKYPEVVDYEF
jgi:DNA repair protein RadD